MCNEAHEQPVLIVLGDHFTFTVVHIHTEDASDDYRKIVIAELDGKGKETKLCEFSDYKFQEFVRLVKQVEKAL